MHNEPQPTAQLTLRLPRSVLKRLDAIAARADQLYHQRGNLASRCTRSTVIRQAIEHALALDELSSAKKPLRYTLTSVEPPPKHSKPKAG